MSNTSGQTYRELSFPYYKDAFFIIDKICGDLGVEYYLIGAQARDFQMLERGIRPTRGTKDIDFAVMLPEMKAYNELIELLCKSGFRKVTEHFRLIYDLTSTVVDFLPFGEIEEEGTVKFTELEIELSAVGLKEVGGSADSFDVEGITIKASPLEGIVILKLISYTNRNDRKKDLDDIREIVNNYFHLNTDRLYEHHLDITENIPEENFMLLTGARLLGRNMNAMLTKSPELNDRITGTK